MVKTIGWKSSSSQYLQVRDRKSINEIDQVETSKLKRKITQPNEYLLVNDLYMDIFNYLRD